MKNKDMDVTVLINKECCTLFTFFIKIVMLKLDKKKPINI